MPATQAERNLATRANVDVKTALKWIKDPKSVLPICATQLEVAKAAIEEEKNPTHPMNFEGRKKKLYDKILELFDEAKELSAAELEEMARSVQIHGSTHEGGGAVDNAIDRLLQVLSDWSER